jgi:hypothetical protein
LATPETSRTLAFEAFSSAFFLRLPLLVGQGVDLVQRQDLGLVL